MQEVRVATYRLTNGATFTQIADAAKVGMLDTFRKASGFRRYEVADLGDGELISISLWDSAEAAEQGTALAREWVAENLAGKIELRSNHIGEVAFSES